MNNQPTPRRHVKDVFIAPLTAATSHLVLQVSLTCLGYFPLENILYILDVN